MSLVYGHVIVARGKRIAKEREREKERKAAFFFSLSLGRRRNRVKREKTSPLQFSLESGFESIETFHALLYIIIQRHVTYGHVARKEGPFRIYGLFRPLLGHAPGQRG